MIQNDTTTQTLPAIPKERSTDPEASTLKVRRLASWPRWKTPFLVQGQYKQLIDLVYAALEHCYWRHHGKVARVVFLPMSVPGEHTVVYRDVVVAVRGNLELPKNIVWCIGE